MRYGLIGEHLGHSFSKIIHEQLADYTYDLIELNKEEFKTFMDEKPFRAINVTIPYKEAVIPYLSEIEASAKKMGAVNCIVNRNGILHGYNTDYAGFRYTLLHNQILPAQKKVLVLGYGGASKAIIAVLEDLQAGEIHIANRSPKPGSISFEEAYSNHTDADIIINTTPVGMYPAVDASPLDLSKFPSAAAVVDIIYNPKQTKLLQQAESLGMKAINGLEMLIAQAKYACEIFLDTPISDDVIEKIKL